MHDELDGDDEAIPPEFAQALARVALEILDIGDGDEIAARFAAYRDDPVGFFRDKLGGAPWTHESETDQYDVIYAVGTSDRVAVKSGHKTSKSFTASGLALWWVATRVNARAVLTAPAFHQIKNIIWKELRARFRIRPLAAQLQAEPALDPATGLQLPNGNEIIGISTKTAENLAGLSSPHLFFIVDESSGFPDNLWETIMGNAAGGAKLFAISNPTRTKGWFFNLFRTRAKGWTLLTLSSEHTPNVLAERVVIPGLARIEWVQEMRELYGPNYAENTQYMVRVLGEFPGQDVDAVISATALDRAAARWKPRVPLASEGELTFGVDVARFGNDDNAIQPVRGNYAYELRTVDTTLARNDPELVAGVMVADAIIAYASELRQGNERVRVNVDGIGVGASVVDALAVSDAVRSGWIYVVDMNVGEAADEQDTIAGGERVNYANLRSQVWFGVAEWLRRGALPDTEAMHQELLAATYTLDPRGRIVVESKKQMRAVLGRSPDYADALCLAVYRGTRGSWTSFAYDGVSDDPRHPSAQSKPRSAFWSHGGSDDDDDSGGGAAGGSYSFL